MPHQKSTADLVKEIKGASGCTHPIRLSGEFVNTAAGEVKERLLLVACNRPTSSRVPFVLVPEYG